MFNNSYGTYTTIDAPTKRQGEALDYLTRQFEKIGATTYEKQNSHDFGSYPSFEVDYPTAIEDAKEAIENRDLYADCEDEEIPDYILTDWKTEEDCEDLQKKVDNWTDEADKIETAYSKKYSEYL
jgi:hypothetical protein